MRALLLNLRVGPVGAFPARVLEQDHLPRLRAESLFRGFGIESDLHAFPVAFVQIVELVEVPEEPVLEGDSPLARFPRDVGVDANRDLAGTLQRIEILRVDAGVPERLPFEVDEVLFARSGDIGPRR